MTAETNDKLQADYALMGGLLSEVGKLVFASNYPDQFVEIDARIAAGDQREVDVEKEIMGHSHTEVGAYLIGLWGLPNPVVECVAFHHEPGDCVDAGFAPLTAVHAATAIVTGGSQADEIIDAEYLAALGVTDRLPDWIALNDEIQSANEESGSG